MTQQSTHAIRTDPATLVTSEVWQRASGNLTLLHRREVNHLPHDTHALSPIAQEFQRLQELRDLIQKSGPIMAAFIWIDPYSTRGIQYARLRSDRPLWSGKKQKGIGRVGGVDYRDWEQRWYRREAISEIDRRLQTLQHWMDNPIWEPETD